MPRQTTKCFLALLLLSFVTASYSAEPETFLSEETCEAPFLISVPASVVRAHRGLDVVAHAGEAGTGLIFSIGVKTVSVSLRRGDSTVELARAAAPLPAKDGQVVLKRLVDGVAVAYDGVTVLRQAAELLDGGQWGVVGGSAEVLEEITLQPLGQIEFSDDFMRTPDQPSSWEDVSGSWQVSQLQSARYSANAFTLVGTASGSRAAVSKAGYWFWEDLTVEASVQPSPGAAGFGVQLGCQPDGRSYLLRFVSRQGPIGVAQLVRLQGNREVVLAEAPASAGPDDWHRLSLSGVGGRLSGTLDGIELVTAQAPELAHGQVALWVAGPEPVAFDDVDVYGGEHNGGKPVVLSHEAQMADPTAQAFIDDHYMQQWADERDQWLVRSGGMWHAGTYWGDVALTCDLGERGLTEEVQLHIGVPVGADTLTPLDSGGAGCHLVVKPAADGQLDLTLREGAETREQKLVPLPELQLAVTLRRVGDTIEAVIGDDVVAAFDTGLPAAGKVGLSARYARRYAGNLSIVSRHVIDSTFRSAPTDWSIGSGEWGVASRWACSPRWSWFQGRSRHLASIWTRRSFDGDVVVEFFAGLSMDQPWAPFYRHPGNLAVTLCGSDETPGSGYSLVFGGWGNSAAGIFRRGELVAKVPGFTMPDIIDSLGGTTGREDAHKLHNEWRRIRAERIGSTIRLIVDGRLAASFDDPDPLPNGAVGIWTLNQGITVARARIYYAASEPGTPAPLPSVATAPREALKLPRFGPVHLSSTFEQGSDGWGPAEAGSCLAAVARRDGPGAGSCLEVINPTAGGSFALQAPYAGVDLRHHPLLAFDYAIPPDVQVDLFARIGGQRYRVALSGPEQPSRGIEDIGAVTGARADGRWQSARVDLLALLAPYFPGQAPIVLEALEFAAHAVPEYVLAGVGGNGARAAWRLDNVYLGAVASAPVDVSLPTGVEVTASGCQVTKAVRGARVTPAQSGLVSVMLASPATSGTDLLAFDLEPPTLEAAEPAPGHAWLGPMLAVRVRDAGPAGIDEQSLGLQVGGQRFALTDEALRWRPGEGKLTLDLRKAALQLVAGQPVEVLATASDRAGNRAAPLQFAFTPQLQADTAPPDAPALAGLPAPLLDCDFEGGTGSIQPWGADARVALTRVRGPVAGYAPGGQWCLQAQSLKLGGLFGVSLGVAPFEASRYPVLEFDYRAPAELRVDLIVEVGGSRRVIKFTDNDQTWPLAGRMRAVADDRWHHAAVDLYGLLNPMGRSGPLVITELAFASSGWPGTRDGICWWLDNVRLSPALNVKALPPDLALQSHDESGVSSFGLAATPPGATSPADLPAAALRETLAAQTGLVWLHAQAIDGAGNRSATAILPVRLASSDDSTLPVASAATPANGARACPAAISATITDEGAGVSPADLRLTINGRTWSVADDELRWNAATGQLNWSLPAGLSLGDNGAQVQCRLEAADLAGNALKPLEWAFVLDYGMDQEPPAAPSVSYVPARQADGNDFETDSGGWGNFMDGQVLRMSEGGATGPGCLEIRHLASRGRGSAFVLVRDFGEAWRDFPMLTFRYRVVNARGAGLQVFGTTFDGDGDRWTPLATLPVGGGEWQRAEVDIARALASSQEIHRIFLSVDLPLDGALLVDDYAMYSAVTDRATFRWAAPASASGIKGYSWVLDSADGTMPPEKIRGTQLHADFQRLKPGRYVFHVRACDGAGNWGAASHVPIEIAPKPAEPDATAPATQPQ